jgi:hypothetical protein
VRLKGEENNIIKITLKARPPITPFVNLFIHPLETAPTIEIIPEIIKVLYVFLRSIQGTEFRDGLDAGETRFALENGGKCGDEGEFGVLYWG